MNLEYLATRHKQRQNGTYFLKKKVELLLLKLTRIILPLVFSFIFKIRIIAKSNISILDIFFERNNHYYILIL
jgi:hypothetical protein